MKQRFIGACFILLMIGVCGCDMDPVSYDGSYEGHTLHHGEIDGGNGDAGAPDAGDG